jgi:RNA ligase (TIGR02306 family)
LAVFIPPDSVLPTDPESPILKDNPYLKPGGRVNAVRLRGIFSNGFMIPAKMLFTENELSTIEVGTHIADRIGITKYVDEGERLSTGGENERDPGFMPCYTDIEGWPKYRNSGVITEKTPVVITEKIHGANARFCFRDGRLWVGSRNNIKAQYIRSDGTEGNLWWKVAKELNLEEKFAKLPDDNQRALNTKSTTIIYGEVFGQVQDLKYGVSGCTFRVFDTYSVIAGRYNSWPETISIAHNMGLETVPELYCGLWNPELEELRNGPSVLYPGHIREGFVVKPLMESYVPYTNSKTFSGRVIFKYVGEDYKTRKKQ